MLGELITQAMVMNHEDNVRDYVGISGIGYCELKLQRLFQRKDVAEVPPAQLLAFLTGTGTHELIFKLLWKYRGKLEGFKYNKREKEVSVTTARGNILKGHLDLDAEIKGVKLTADLKVVDERAFEYLSEPYQHQVDQVMMYSFAEKLKDWLIVYFCKGGSKKGQFKEFSGKVDERRIAFLLEKYDRIMSGEANKPFETPDGSWECGYCQYYKECWGEKEYIKKQSGIEEITNVQLELRYIELKAQYDQAKDDLNDVKEELTAGLNGKRGEGEHLSAIFYKGGESVSYDSTLLKHFVDPKVLEKCTKISQKSGYYALRIHK